MGREVIKPEADKDFYVIFSTISDEPLCWGKAEDLLRWFVKDQFANKFTTTNLFDDRFVETLLRVDERGTSSRLSAREFDDEMFINWCGEAEMPRANLIKALELVESGKKLRGKAVMALTVPFDWED